MQKFLSLFEKFYFYILVALLAIIPLYPKLPLVSVAKTFVAIRLEDILISLAVLLWLWINVKQIKYYLSQTITQAFILFWFIGALSVFSGIFVTHSVEPSLGILHFVRRVEYMILFFLAATTVSNIHQVKLASKVLIVVAAVVVLYGFGQLYLNFPVVSTTNSEFSKGLILRLTEGARVNSTFAGHYDLAMFLTIALSIISVFFFYENSEINWRNLSGILSKKWIVTKQLLLGILGGLAFLLLGLTAARVSLVATLAALSVAFWISKKKILLLGLIILTCGLIVGIPELRHRLVATVTVNILGGGGPKYSPPPGTVNMFTPEKSIPKEQRTQVLEQIKKDATDPAKQVTGVSRDVVPGEPINTTELGVYRSFGIRFDVEWPRALNAWYKNPLLGTGYASITLATDNDYLRSLGETGLLGTIAFILIFAILIKKMIWYLNNPSNFERYFIIGMLSATIGLLITAVFIDVFEASKIAEIYWLLMGFAWAILTNYELNSKKESR